MPIGNTCHRVWTLIHPEDIANDILRLVVDTPEDEDFLWRAYQDEEPHYEEEEARMMESNEV